MDDATTWDLIHEERAGVADTLETLTPEQWAQPALCSGWSVRVTAGHIVVGAEQTTGKFMRGLAANAFRFNRMMDRDASRVGACPPAEIVERLRARTTTTNRPPAPLEAMLGEVVVHGEDIRRPLRLAGTTNPEAVAACLAIYQDARFPVGAKQRIDGLHMVATDIDWEHGSGPEVSGTGMSLLLAMTGRAAGLDDLTGDGLHTLTGRMPATTG
jgi:uncharacterized protein (TIGR03083 family)